MKKFLQRNLNKEAQELMEMQSLLKESDHENRELNRQVLKLLQENTRLKMDKVQNNIVGMPSECRKTVQKICSRHIEEYRGRSRQQKGQASPQIGRLKISITSSNTPARDKQNQTQLGAVQRDEGQLQNSVFFTFGTNSRPGSIIGENRQPTSNQLQRRSKSKDKQNSEVKPKPGIPPAEYRLGYSISKNHSQLNNKDGSVPKKLRTVHSIRPSPQITPQRDLSHLTSTPTRSSNQLESHLIDPPQPPALVPSSIEKKKKYMDIVSVFLTPTRSTK